jgi:hypothetical protein
VQVNLPNFNFYSHNGTERTFRCHRSCTRRGIGTYGGIPDAVCGKYSAITRAGHCRLCKQWTPRSGVLRTVQQNFWQCKTTRRRRNDSGDVLGATSLRTRGRRRAIFQDESESPGFYFALGTRVPFDAIGGLFVAPVPQDLRLIPLPTPEQ